MGMECGSQLRYTGATPTLADNDGAEAAPAKSGSTALVSGAALGEGEDVEWGRRRKPPRMVRCRWWMVLNLWASAGIEQHRCSHSSALS